MVRSRRQNTNSLGELEREIDRQFAGCPHSAIGVHFKSLIIKIREDIAWSGLEGAELRRFVRDCKTVMNRIPTRDDITDRFWFDISMIGAIRAEWSRRNKLLPESILPRVGAEWQHSLLWLPSFEPARIPRIDVVDFPGQNRCDDVHLLDYPWLIHELGHSLMYLHDDGFTNELELQLDKRRRASAQISQGTTARVRQHAQAVRQNQDQKWRPSNDHRDWSHEIAIDVVALWSAGPAFLAAYDDVLEDKEPFVVNEIHPPYHLRTMALLEAARRLGLRPHLSALTQRLDEWNTSREENEPDNSYEDLFDEELLHGVVSAALNYCVRLDLPRCDQNTIEEAETLITCEEPLPFGRKAMLAAWIMYERCSGRPDEYHTWELSMVGKMVREVRH